MTILYHPRRSVNRNRAFGLGLGRNQADRLPFGPSAADREWAASELNKDSRDYVVVATAEDRHFDRLAEEAGATDLLCRGYVFA